METDPMVRDVSVIKTTDPESGSNSDDEEQAKFKVEPAPINEDIYGMTICSLICDSAEIQKGKKGWHNHAVRLFTTMFVLIVCISIQVALLSNTWEFVVSKAVRDIRDAYDVFEAAMYTNTTLSPNGKHRGVTGTFQPENFGLMSDSDQNAACRIPLSQPQFFFLILLIWTLTCCNDLKQSIFLFRSLIINTKTDNTFQLEDLDGEDGDQVSVKHLPMWTKSVITVFVLIPRAGIAILLTWLGCRWLLATTCFSDLILNAVALEFILLLKDTLYMTLMTRKNQLDVQNTFIQPPNEEEIKGIAAFAGTVAWLLVAVGWVFLYMGIPGQTEGIQAVLPGYKWDVRVACQPWIAWRYCVDATCPPDPSNRTLLEM